MQVTAPIYEKPSRLSQGLVIALSAAVVAMAGWLVMTILDPQATTTAAEGETDAAASPPAGAPPLPAPQSPADATPADATPADATPAPRAPRPATRSVQFDWPEEFNSTAAPPARTALPLAPAESPPARDPGITTWPAAVAVPDNDRAFAAARRQQQPQPAAVAGANATDAIVDLLTPPPAPQAAPPTRSVPARR
jgi:hypothetical protein